jgi:hypothetical protein
MIAVVISFGLVDVLLTAVVVVVSWVALSRLSRWVIRRAGQPADAAFDLGSAIALTVAFVAFGGWWSLLAVLTALTAVFSAWRLHYLTRVGAR